MGSKSSLLAGELGEILLLQADRRQKFVDLFCGSGAVSHFISESLDVPTHSVDLQQLSVTLALSITSRTSPLEDFSPFDHWIKLAKEAADANPYKAELQHASRRPSRTSVLEARRLSKRLAREAPSGFAVDAYGGHYFSPIQALAIDELWSNLPEDPSSRTVAIACLVRASSRCAAAPGHTAQPFQPTQSLLPYIWEAWKRDLFAECEAEVRAIAPRHARTKVGAGEVSDACAFAAREVKPGDLVFCDPPYSAVQYSRFYHVLEAIASGGFQAVSGAGRAPELSERKSSLFSTRTGVRPAMADLLDTLAENRASVILTFPSEDTTLGYTGGELSRLASQRFSVQKFLIPHIHSTLGGPALKQDSKSSSPKRVARRSLNEMVLLMEPRRR